MATAKNIYRASPLANPENLLDLVAYIRGELDAIERAFILVLPNPLDVLHKAPTKVFDGLTVLADGVDWNPGGGKGVYTYYSAAWNKLG